MTLHNITIHYNALQYMAIHGNTLQRINIHYNTLQLHAYIHTYIHTYICIFYIYIYIYIDIGRQKYGGKYSFDRMPPRTCWVLVSWGEN